MWMWKWVNWTWFGSDQHCGAVYPVARRWRMSAGAGEHSSGYWRQTTACTWPYPAFPNILLGIFLCPLDAAVTQKYSRTISVGFCSRYLLYQTGKATSGLAKLYGFSPINQTFFLTKELSLTFCSLLTWQLWTLGPESRCLCGGNTSSRNLVMFFEGDWTVHGKKYWLVGGKQVVQNVSSAHIWKDTFPNSCVQQWLFCRLSTGIYMGKDWFREFSP